MADLRIGTGGIVPQQTEFEEFEPKLGLTEEATSLPEWMGWDRIENASLAEISSASGLEVPLDAAPLFEKLRQDPQYANLIDVDDKRFYLDVVSQISNKLEQIAEGKPSDRINNLLETVNELLDLYQTAYSQQISNVKG